MSDPRKGLPSCSSAPRVAACPGSLLAPRTVPPDDSTDDSRRGDRIHAWLAWMLPGGLQCDKPVAASLACGEELDTAESLYWSAKNTARDLLGKDACLVHAEQRLWYRDNGIPIYSGQADAVWFSEAAETALIIDHKTGWGEVEEPASNLQLRDLAVILRQNYADVRQVYVWINQPGNKCEPVLYAQGDLAMAEGEMLLRLRRGSEPDAPRIAGDHCKYCPARVGCPARLEALETMPTPAEQVKPATLSDSLLLTLYDRYQVVKKLGAEIEAEVKARAERDADAWMLRGVTLQPGRKVRQITDPSLVADRLVEMGATWHDVATAFQMQLGVVESMLRELAGLKGKALHDAMDALLLGAVAYKESAPSIKRIKALAEGRAA